MQYKHPLGYKFNLSTMQQNIQFVIYLLRRVIRVQKCVPSRQQAQLFFFVNRSLNLYLLLCYPSIEIETLTSWSTKCRHAEWCAAACWAPWWCGHRSVCRCRSTCQAAISARAFLLRATATEWGPWMRDACRASIAESSNPLSSPAYRMEFLGLYLPDTFVCTLLREFVSLLVPNRYHTQ